MNKKILTIFFVVALALVSATAGFVAQSYAVPSNCELLRGGKMKCYSSDGNNWWTTTFSGWNW